MLVKSDGAPGKGAPRRCSRAERGLGYGFANQSSPFQVEPTWVPLAK
jgi:hypothetical protein